MTITSDLQDMEGRIAVDATGAKLGKIGQVYVDSRTGEPLWVTISTGMFGTKQNFAPLYGCQSDGDNLRLAVTKDMVKGAPGIEAAGHLEDDESEALYAYYEGYAGGSAQGAPAGYEAQEYAGVSREDRSGRDGIQGRDTSGPTTDSAVTRSEDRLRAGRENTDANRGAATSGSDIDDPDTSR